jgi:hypothetical protein
MAFGGTALAQTADKGAVALDAQREKQAPDLLQMNHELIVLEGAFV